jgi:uncharacterized membrane protein YkvA (DUF1232 family)
MTKNSPVLSSNPFRTSPNTRTNPKTSCHTDASQVSLVDLALAPTAEIGDLRTMVHQARPFDQKETPSGPVVDIDAAKTDTDYSGAYSESRFRTKLARYALSAGQAVVEKALVLFYALRDPGTPTRAKAIVIGALGYFIMPLDAIPDLIPGAGFIDDLGAIAIALTLVAAHIKPVHFDKAEKAAIRIFNPKIKG